MLDHVSVNSRVVRGKIKFVHLKGLIWKDRSGIEIEITLNREFEGVCPEIGTVGNFEGADKGKSVKIDVMIKQDESSL